MFKFIRRHTEFSRIGKNQIHEALASVISDNKLYKESMELLSAPSFQEFYLADTSVTRSYWLGVGHCMSVVHSMSTLEAYVSEWCLQLGKESIVQFIQENQYARLNQKLAFYQELKRQVKLYHDRLGYTQSMQESTMRAIDTILYFCI